jgi:hypothetical protein
MDILIKKITDLRVKVYSGQSNEDTEKELYDLEQFIFKIQDNVEFQKLVAIQDYLLEHGTNDEKINDKIRKLQNIKTQ